MTDGTNGKKRLDMTRNVGVAYDGRAQKEMMAQEVADVYERRDNHHEGMG